jgi:hypothetical protein
MIDERLIRSGDYRRLPTKLTAVYQGSDRALLCALCNDGTMWVLDPPSAWRQLPEIPQPARNE